jgi:FKBP-type peptidyl-prolyl cis-trans isomerase (trigger factor)
MQVSVETTGTVERRLTVGVPKEHIKPKIQSRLQSLAHQTKFNGFRPGKVPMRVVEQRYGEKVREEIFSEVLQSSFSEAITQEKLYPVGDPNFDFQSDIKKIEDGLSYVAIFEIYPDIPQLKVDNFSIKKSVTEITESDVDSMLDRLRQQRKTSEDELPEMDEEFIKSFGVDDGTIETLRIEARKNMEAELKYAVDAEVKNQLLDALLETNPIDVPNVLVQQEAKYLLEGKLKNTPDLEVTADMFKDEATKKVKIGFLVRELIKEYKIEAPSEKIQKIINNLAVAYNMPEETVKQYYSDKQRLQEIESLVLEDEVVAFLLEKSNVTEKPSEFYKIIDQK